MARATNDNLYNKYRPKKYEDLIGQLGPAQTLKAIIKNKSYGWNRNFLFHSNLGGVGKSTIASIFAKAVNCQNTQNGEACHECRNCKAFEANAYSDMIYINGAEFNTVEKVKPLVSIAKQHPANPDGMKIILIDEVQRMSSQAMSEFLDLFEFSFNKTMFLLTTTNVEKVAQPIRTRCFKFELLPTTTNQMVGNLASICKKEDIVFDIDSLEKIAEKSEGSMREAIQLMSQYSEAYGEIKDLPIDFRYDSFSELINLCKEGDILTLQNKLIQMPMADIYDQFSKFLFQRYLKTKCVIPIDSFLKYKPTEYNSMLLYFVQLNEELNKEIVNPIVNKQVTDVPKKVYTPLVVENIIDNSPFMTRHGFKKEG